MRLFCEVSLSGWLIRLVCQVILWGQFVRFVCEVSEVSLSG